MALNLAQKRLILDYLGTLFSPDPMALVDFVLLPKPQQSAAVKAFIAAKKAKNTAAIANLNNSVVDQQAALTQANSDIDAVTTALP